MDLIIKYAIPEIRSNRYITIWSAGCSEGQEPYTLAIKLREKVGAFSFRKMKIIATDIDNTTGKFGETIVHGIYPKRMVERVEQSILSSYFIPLNGGLDFRIVDEVKNAVQFQQHDLLSFKEIRKGFNIILCKNVLMHFNKQQRVGVIKMFHRALAANGYLAMERTQKMPEEMGSKFHRITEKGQIYKKR